MYLGCLPLSFVPLSAAGWESGYRRKAVFGLAVVSLAFLWLFEPVAAEMASFPVMTVPVLVMSGALLVRKQVEAVALQGRTLEEFLPVLAVIVVMALSFNIPAGVGAGVISHCLLFMSAGRKVSLSERIMSVAFLVYLVCGFL